MGSRVVSPPRRSASPASTATPPRVAPWFPILLSLGVAAAFWFLVVGQYHAAQAELAVVSEVDYSGLSTPEPAPFASLLATAAGFTLLLGPLVSMWVGAWSATWAWLSWEQLRSRDRVFLLVAAAAALAVVAYLVSPTGREVIRFHLD